MEVSDAMVPPVKFNPADYLIRIQGGKEYLPVSARLKWFRMEHPDWGIVTNPVEINLEKQYAIYSATIFSADGRVIATATNRETARGFADYIEKAETSAVGRALAFAGYAAGNEPDLDEGARLADAPLNQRNTSASYDANSPVCQGCNAGITSAAATMSERKYGRPLCPQCQRTEANPV